jgi:hypothetical protein
MSKQAGIERALDTSNNNLPVRPTQLKVSQMVKAVELEWLKMMTTIKQVDPGASWTRQSYKSPLAQKITTHVSPGTSILLNASPQSSKFAKDATHRT